MGLCAVDVRVARGVEERLVVLERHVRILRVGVRRVERPAPAHLALRDPLPAAVRQTPLCRDERAVAALVRPGERAGVLLRPDGHERVELLDLLPLDGRQVGDLLVGALGDEDLVQPVERQVRVRIRAGSDGGAVEREGERLGDRVAVDAEHLASSERERVPDDEIGKTLDALVDHRSVIPRGKAAPGWLTVVGVPSGIAQTKRVCVVVRSQGRLPWQGRGRAVSGTASGGAPLAGRPSSRGLP